jgi:hypothetical protein
MKKLLTLSTALLFTAGAAFAQSNDASVSQNGDDNDANIEQLGTGNSAELNQGFNGQGQNGAFGEIIQDGEGNNASMNQRAWGNDGNDHTIEQLGHSNSGDVDIYNGDNSGYILQDGVGNSARMVQSSTGHESLILQTGSENYAQSSATGGTGNQTAIVQGIPSEFTGGIGIQGQVSLDDAPVLIPLFGSQENVATMSVSGSNNMAGILQLGGGNTAGTNPGYAGDKGIDISGDANAAGIAQLGFENDATISVMGNANMAGILQLGSDNSGSIMQDGSGNTAVILQSGMGLGPVLD